MTQKCPLCGGASFHYNKSRMRMECSNCGAPISNIAEQERQMEYDRTYQQAMGHLQAGNWDNSISMLKPLLSQKPTDKNVYIAIVKAATEDFHDFTMNNSNRRNAAYDAWNKLIRLNGVTSSMTGYSRKCHERYMSELLSQKNWIMAWLFISSMSFIFAGIAFSESTNEIALLSMILALFSLYKAIKKHPFNIIRQLSEKQPDYNHNPFI